MVWKGWKTKQYLGGELAWVVLHEGVVEGGACEVDNALLVVVHAHRDTAVVAVVRNVVCFRGCLLCDRWVRAIKENPTYQSRPSG